MRGGFQMKDEIKVIGDFSWKETKDFLICKLKEIDNEEDFGEFIKNVATSIGTLKQIKAQRKRLGLKPLTKEEEKELSK